MYLNHTTTIWGHKYDDIADNVINLIAWLFLALEYFRCVVATFTWIKRLNTSVPTEGNTSELQSRQKRIADRLWAGKPSAERRAGERHGTPWVLTVCVHTSGSILSGCCFIDPLQVTFYVILSTSGISLSTEAVNITLLLQTWGRPEIWQQSAVTGSVIGCLWFCIIFPSRRTSEQDIQPVEALARVAFELEMQVYG